MRNVSSWGRRGLGASGLGLLLILSAGCGSKGSVSGKVTMKDEPLRGGMVTFITPDNTWTSASAIATDGTYSIEKVPTGPVKISVISVAGQQRMRAKFKDRMPKEEDAKGDDLPPQARRKAKMGASGEPPPSGPAIPKKYNDPETSELIYDVKPGKQEHNIDLK